MTDLITPLEWDSEFFDLKIGRGVVTDTGDMAELIRQVRSGQFDCVYLLLEGDDFDGRDSALAAGFLSVGQRVTFRTESLPANTRDSTVEIRLATTADLNHLEPIARDSFRDSRFFWDPGFPNERAADLYTTWLNKSVSDGYADATFCAVVDGAPSAFVTCDVHRRDSETVGQIGLVGVGPAARGRGVGSALVESAHDFYRSMGAAAAEVVTHGTNLAAQRLYSRYDYRPHQIQSWFHLWSD